MMLFVECLRVLISTDRFGIFRLTDPGGLQVILDCQAKDAFHPHPEVPIYTVRKPTPELLLAPYILYRTVIIVTYK